MSINSKLEKAGSVKAYPYIASHPPSGVIAIWVQKNTAIVIGWSADSKYKNEYGVGHVSNAFTEIEWKRLDPNERVILAND